MRIPFNDILVQFSSPDAAIEAQWARLFAGWPSAEEDAFIDITLHLELADALPALPASPPFFSDAQRYPGEAAILEVYQAEGECVILYFLDGAWVKLPLAWPANKPLTANGVITANVLTNGRFLDVVYTSLAPLFRRFGYYMVHAFAAVKNGRGVLIVGPSGSGKTTTGLSLVLAGWQLLSNDVLLIQDCPAGIIAHPTPDNITIRPYTLTLLPELAALALPNQPLNRGVVLTGNDLTNGCWAAPSPIERIYIPQVEGEREQSEKRPLSRAVCLAQIMAESIDRWDGATLEAHSLILQKLCQQVQAYTLHLGSNVSKLPDVMREA